MKSASLFAICLLLFLLPLTTTQTLDIVLKSTGPRPFNKDRRTEDSPPITPLSELPVNPNLEDTASEQDSAKRITQILQINSPGFEIFKESIPEPSSPTHPPFHPRDTSIDNVVDSKSIPILPHGNKEDLDSQQGVPFKEIQELPEDNSDLLKQRQQTYNSNQSSVSLPSSLSRKNNDASSSLTAGELQNDPENSLTNETTHDPSTTLPKLHETGSLYVDNVRTNIHPPRRLRVGSATPCPVADFEDTDMHRLSNSQFGYPKSIVNNALSQSQAVIVLKILAGQLQVFNNPINVNTTPKQSLTKPGYSGQFSFNTDTLQTSPLGNYFGGPLPQNDMEFGKQSDMFNGMHSTLQEKSNEKLNFGSTIKSNPALDFPFDAPESEENTSPHLLDGSAFHGQADDIRERVAYGQEDVETNFSQEVQSQTLPEPEMKQTLEQNSFSNQLPDVSSSGSSWFPSDIYPASFPAFDSRPPVAYNSGIESLFPPKTSDNFLDVSSSRDFGGEKKEDSFIKYSPDQSSSVSSPFQLDTKSLFSSISGVSLGENSAPSTQQQSNRGVTGFQTNPVMFSSGTLTSFPGNSDKKFTQGFDNSRFGITSQIRRKRQAINENVTKRTKSSENVCATSYKILRQYKNYGGSCFVVQPEIQAILYTSCTNTRCRGCGVDDRDSRCQAVRVPMWVWSYCEQGPRAGLVTADRVAVSVACTCKVSICPARRR